MLRLRSHAKINWHLEVRGRRADGYHELRTLFQTIELADEIDLERSGGEIDVRIEGESLGLEAGPANLAWRAARSFLDRFAPGSGDGVRITLRKRVPLGSGLGGGSSNAATVLSGLAALWGVDRGDARLVEIAARLGADVPFFLTGGVALGRGRGDEIAALPDADTGDQEIWLAVPPFAVPTRSVFEAYRPGARRVADDALERALAGELPRDLSALATWNDLEPTCLDLFPPLGELYNALASRARWVRLSGSGGTVCALFADAREAADAGRALPGSVRWLRTRTMRRSAWRDSVGC
jgi:4-diphosphocytidyl-2-C-methyl-D-erythritol kinase